MKKIFFILSFFTFSFAQTYPTITQTDRDSMKYMKEGDFFFNTTSGCINYFFNAQWFEICGDCSPNPVLANIEKVEHYKGTSIIYFSPFVKGVNYIIYTSEKDSFIVNEYPFKTTMLGNGKSYSFKIKSYTTCDTNISMWSQSYLIEEKDYCNGKKEIIFNEKKYSLESLGNACWIKEPIQYSTTDNYRIENEKNKIITLNNQTYFSQTALENFKVIDSSIYYNNTQICPKGFYLPSIGELKNLNGYFMIQPDLQLFNYPYGGYDFAGKKIEGNQFVLFWLENGTHFVVSTGKNYTINEVQPNVGLQIRCVQ